MSQALGGWTAGPRGVPSPRNPSSTLTCGRSRRTQIPHLGSALVMVVSGQSVLPEAARPQMLCPTQDLSNLRGGILGGGSEDMRGAHNSPGLPTLPPQSTVTFPPARLPRDTPTPMGHPISPETPHLPRDTPSSPVCLDQKGEESSRNARTLPTRVPQA